MYFYIIDGPFRVGFGITSDFTRREKDYTGAWGGEARFSYLFEGPTNHIKNLEHLIKTQHQDLCWKIDDWATEWMGNGWTAEQVLTFVKEIIEERHIPATQIR